MTRLIVLLLIMFGGVWTALYSFEAEDYVVIGVGEWVVQMSLVVFAGLLAFLFVPAYLIVRGSFALWRSPRRFRAWRRDRQDRNAQAMLNHGLTLLMEGGWRRGEKELLRAVDAGANPMLGYIAAARAAQALGAHDRRDNYLREAGTVQPAASVAVGLTQAELQLDVEQREQALATLVQLRSQAPGHGRILDLLKRLYEELNDWKNLLNLVPALKTAKVISGVEAEQLEHRAHAGLLLQAARDETEEVLDRRWRAMSKSLQAQPELLGLYTELKMERDAGDECEHLISSVLNKHWDTGLVRLYGQLSGNDLAAQLKTAEGWLEGRDGDAVLLQCLGRLCVRNRLWGKARSYLDASVGIEPRAETFAVLVELLDEVDDPQAAGDYARRGLTHAEPVPSYAQQVEMPRLVGPDSHTRQ